jgi:hypothetical protein
LGVTISVLSSPSERGEEEVRCSVQSSAYTERPIPHLVEEKPLPSSDRGTHNDTQTGKRSHKPTIGKRLKTSNSTHNKRTLM